MFILALIFIALALVIGFWGLKAKASIVTAKAVTGFYKFLFIVCLILGFLTLLYSFIESTPTSSATHQQSSKESS